MYSCVNIDFCKGTLEEALKEEKHIILKDSDKEDELEGSDADEGNGADERNGAREGNNPHEGNGAHEVNVEKDVSESSMKTPIRRKRCTVCVSICVCIRLNCCQYRNQQEKMLM